jgi:hypothetical protein
MKDIKKNSFFINSFWFDPVQDVNMLTNQELLTAKGVNRTMLCKKFPVSPLLSCNPPSAPSP